MAQTLDCSVEGSLKAIAGQPPVEMSFSNSSAEPRNLYWIDYQGQRQSYGVIAPGNARGQPSSEGNHWVVTDAADNCLAIYTASAAQPDFDVGSPVVATAAPAAAPQTAALPQVSPVDQFQLSGIFSITPQIDGSKLLNTEAAGTVEFDPLNPSWDSEQWSFEAVPGTPFVRIKNGWKNTYLTDTNGSLRATNSSPDAEETHWTFEPVQGTNSVQFRNRSTDHFLFASGSPTLVDDFSEAQQANSAWLVTPFSAAVPGVPAAAALPPPAYAAYQAALDSCSDIGGIWTGSSCRAPDISQPLACAPGWVWSSSVGECIWNGGGCPPWQVGPGGACTSNLACSGGTLGISGGYPACYCAPGEVLWGSYPNLACVPSIASIATLLIAPAVGTPFAASHGFIGAIGRPAVGQIFGNLQSKTGVLNATGGASTTTAPPGTPTGACPAGMTNLGGVWGCKGQPSAVAAPGGGGTTPPTTPTGVGTTAPTTPPVTPPAGGGTTKATGGGTTPGTTTTTDPKTGNVTTTSTDPKTGIQTTTITEPQGGGKQIDTYDPATGVKTITNYNQNGILSNSQSYDPKTGVWTAKTGTFDPKTGIQTTTTTNLKTGTSTTVTRKLDGMGNQIGPSQTTVTSTPPTTPPGTALGPNQTTTPNNAVGPGGGTTTAKGGGTTPTTTPTGGGTTTLTTPPVTPPAGGGTTKATGGGTTPPTTPTGVGTTAPTTPTTPVQAGYPYSAWSNTDPQGTVTSTTRDPTTGTQTTTTTTKTGTTTTVTQKLNANGNPVGPSVTTYGVIPPPGTTVDPNTGVTTTTSPVNPNTGIYTVTTTTKTGVKSSYNVDTRVAPPPAPPAPAPIGTPAACPPGYSGTPCAKVVNTVPSQQLQVAPKAPAYVPPVPVLKPGGGGTTTPSGQAATSGAPGATGGGTTTTPSAAQAKAQAEAQAKAQADAAAKAKADAAAAQAKAQAEAQAKAQADAAAKAKADAAAAQAKAQAEAQAKAQAEAQAKAQAEAQAKAQAEAQAKAQAEAQAKAQAAAQARAAQAAQQAAAQRAAQQAAAQRAAQQAAQAKAAQQQKAKCKPGEKCN